VPVVGVHVGKCRGVTGVGGGVVSGKRCGVIGAGAGVHIYRRSGGVTGAGRGVTW
jgi:hypothetical protein